MELKGFFEDFLTEIRPTPEDEKEYQDAHLTLRENLKKDPVVSALLVTSFLQGSYRRKTAVRVDNNDKSDIDVVVVTTIPENAKPAKVVELFSPFLNKFYANKWKPNNRSFEITLEKVKLDLVVTAAPSEADQEILKSEWASSISPPDDKLTNSLMVKDWIAKSSENQFKLYGHLELLTKAEAAGWKTEPLLIPDRKMGEWDRTHPLAQIEWTWEKNANCNTHYINVVKAVKWWKKNHLSLRKYPKGYPLEHIVGFCLDNGTESVPKGIVNTFENIVTKFHSHYNNNTKPQLWDHGVPSHDVLHQISIEDFRSFYVCAVEAAKISGAALKSQDKAESIKLWQKLFGSEKFPGDDENKGGYTPRTEVSDPGKGRFA